MQLFTRAVMLNGPFDAVMSYAADMRQFVSDKTDREVGLWSVMFGAPVGAMVYAARVDGLADLQSIGATLVGDADYHARLAKGREFAAAPAEDNLATPIHGELGDPPPVGSVAVVTTAEIANGAYADAFAWGIDIAQHVERVTGVPTLFLSQDFGAFGAVSWIGVSPDAAAADAAGQKINADPEYVAKLADAGRLFAQGSGHRTLLSRVA
jgi:hypothetical protein